MGKRPTPEELLAVIRANCMDCCGGSRREVHNCKITQCKLWPYRREECAKKEDDAVQIPGQVSLGDFIGRRRKKSAVR